MSVHGVPVTGGGGPASTPASGLEAASLRLASLPASDVAVPSFLGGSVEWPVGAGSGSGLVGPVVSSIPEVPAPLAEQPTTAAVPKRPRNPMAKRPDLRERIPRCSFYSPA